MTKQYKIKNKLTGQFWTGYGSKFTDRGTTFTTADSAVYEVKMQYGLKHQSINDWINDVEIVEYEVHTTEIGPHDIKKLMLRNIYMESLTSQYGKYFTRTYYKAIPTLDDRLKYRHVVEVENDSYSEFRETLKRLGYSSRHYKKVDTWLWISDDDVMARIKLLDYCKNTINLAEHEAEYDSMVDKLEDGLIKLKHGGIFIETNTDED